MYYAIGASVLSLHRESTDSDSITLCQYNIICASMLDSITKTVSCSHFFRIMQCSIPTSLLNHLFLILFCRNMHGGEGMVLLLEKLFSVIWCEEV